MKNSLMFASLLLAFSAFAKKANTGPEPILPITKVTRSFEYYAEQATLWADRAGQTPLDASAWLNYFRAARYANMLAETPAKPFSLEAIVGQMPAALANTFEFNYIHFLYEEKSEGRYGHLLKAHQMDPARQDAYHGLLTYHLTQGEQAEVGFYAEQLFAAGEYSPTLLAWNYNALASVEPGAILLTHGDNDTYPAWVLQHAKTVRPDVRVLNINLLMFDHYRQRVFDELGIAQIDSAAFLEYQQLYLAIARQIMWQAKRPVYVATSVPQFLRDALGDSLYLTGLAFKHSPVPFDNLAILKQNFEKRFLLDHLKIQLEADTGSNVAATMNLHYLPALIMLHRHYTDGGEVAKAAELEPMVRQVAREAGREQEILAYFEEKKPADNGFETGISARSLEKPMMKIKDNLYAASTEVSNEQYEAFLMDLLKNKEFEILAACKSPKTDWRSLLPTEYRHLPDDLVFAHAHPDDPSAPVQNVSHEAALRYCEWVTKVYNRSTDKRKAHQQVLFRLPTEQEWEMAAHASFDAPFPWGGYLPKTEKGCFLANFNVAGAASCEGCTDPKKGDSYCNDGGFFPVKVATYLPNDFGLYNLSGNVAEMIDEPGIAKGGSWEDTPDKCTIDAKKQHTQPSPAIGFRVFMEVE